ncbi:MAG: CpaD family pilus assembly protein [Pseudomonadota bacterium]|nr:CpaD family pilus assembly protein [Pseudomonadota bacterium]MDQ2705487.1 CpaD family pilus assembly protein [Pseudomonadota bacterium]
MSDAFKKKVGLVLAAAAVALLSGCAKRDSITVGAVPDDYRTNHPIVIGEKEETLDLPVGVSDRGATDAQRATLGGFLAGYDSSAAPPLTIIAPSGSANAVAAAEVAKDFAHIARKNGVPANRIMLASYQASPEEVAAPVRVSFVAMRAQTGQCGRWPKDMLETNDNKHYANFGCSYQNNLAAQIANPTDLLGPRKQTPIDPANRGNAIEEYQNRESDFNENIGF